MQKNLCILNEDNKKLTKKYRYFSKNVVHFRVFTNEMECERGKQDFSNKMIVLNATSVLIFQYKNAKKSSFKNIIQLVHFNYYKGKSEKEIADMFF